MQSSLRKIVNSLTLLTPLTIATSAFPQTQLERVLALQQAEIMKLKNQLEPVGTLTASLLTEPQFTALKGPGWVLCDGRIVTGTRFATITGRRTIPNCSGRFLRATGGKAVALGGEQSFGTAVNGMSVPSTTATTSTGSADIRLFTESPNLPNAGAWVIDQSKHGNFLKGGGSASDTLGAGLQSGWRDQGHVHSIIIPATPLVGGSDETRPDNIAVNIFIRVD